MKRAVLTMLAILLFIHAYSQRYQSNSYMANSKKFGVFGITDFEISRKYGIGISYSKYKNAFHYVGDLRYYQISGDKEKSKSILVGYGIGLKLVELANSLNINLIVSPFAGYERKESKISKGQTLDFFRAGGIVRGEMEFSFLKLNTISIGAEQEFCYYPKVSDYVFRRNLYVALRFSF